MKIKGRAHAGGGEKSNNVKLNESQVLEIKNKLQNGSSTAALGREYNMSQAAISNINTGKTWASVKLTKEKTNDQ